MRFDRMASVPSIPVTVDEKNIPKGSFDILRVVRPQWSPSSIDSKVFTYGLSNKLVGFFIKDNPEDTVIVKVFGTNTGKLIDRAAEIETMRILHERKCGAELYATFNNGICYEYMNGSILEPLDCSHPDIYPLVAAEMARMHSTHERDTSTSIDQFDQFVGVVNGGENGKITGTNKNHHNHNQNGRKGGGGFKTNFNSKMSTIWQMIWQFNKLAEDAMKNDATLREKLAAIGVTPDWASTTIEELKKILESKNMPITFCHNDINPHNIVYDAKKKRITFIDVEYAAPNYPAFDIANHFIEFAGPEMDHSRYPDKTFKLKWLTEYLKHLRMGETSEKDFENGNGRKLNQNLSVEIFYEWVEICTPVSHLLWGLWAVHQARHSTINFNYLNYVGLRMEEYKKCMESLRRKEIL